MATAIQQAEKIVVYDGDCPMCRRTIAMLLSTGLLRPEQTRANGELLDEDFAAVSAAGIRNQLVVLEPNTRETRAGVDGLLWIIRDNTHSHPLVLLLGLPGIRHLLRFGYATISYNRRIISPPRRQIVCDCEPEVTRTRRLTLIVPLLAIAAVLVASCGAAVFRAFDLGDAASGARFALAAGGGWVAIAVAGVALLPAGKRIDYVGHQVVTAFVAALFLMPVIVAAQWAPRVAVLAIGALAALAALAIAVAMQRRRVAALAISRYWLWAWLAALAAGAALAVAVRFGPVLG